MQRDSEHVAQGTPNATPQAPAGSGVATQPVGDGPLISPARSNSGGNKWKRLARISGNKRAAEDAVEASSQPSKKLISDAISWNCCGLGTPEAVRALLKPIQEKDPDVVFLMETKKKVSEMQRVRGLGGCLNLYAVDCRSVGSSKAGG